MIYLTDKHNKKTNDASYSEIKKAYLELFRSGGTITLMNDSELVLEIYQSTIILQDYGRFSYDGPGGPGELLRIRVKEGTLLPILDEVVHLLDGYEDKKLVQLLDTLPKLIEKKDTTLLND